MASLSQARKNGSAHKLVGTSLPTKTYAYLLCFIGATIIAISLDEQQVNRFALNTLLVATSFFIVHERALGHFLSPNSRAFAAKLAVLLVFASCSLFLQNLRVKERIHAQLPPEFDGQLFILEGRVASLPERDGPFLRFQMDRTKLEHQQSKNIANLTGKVRLSWRSDQPVVIGERWRHSVKLKRPRGFANPGGFDYQAWLLAKGVVAVGYITDQTSRKLSSAPSTSLWLLRQNVAARLKNLFLQENGVEIQYSEIIQALLIGDKSQIHQSQWKTFRYSGTTHLMAISGLHVGLIAAFFGGVLSIIFRPLVLVCPPIFYRLSVALIGISSAFVYAQLAGFSLPTQRALACVVLTYIILLLERRTYFLPLLGMMACTVLFYQPFALIQSGFVLSFSAVAILLIALSEGKTENKTEFKKSRLKIIWKFLYAQLAIFFGLFPVMSLLGLPSSVVGPIANLVAIPAVSLLILPFSFVALGISYFHDGLALWLFQKTGQCLDGLFRYLQYLEAFNLDFHLNKNMTWMELVVLVVAVIVALGNHKNTMRILGAILYCAIILHAQLIREPNRASVTFLDVGQGLSSVVNGENGALIYDLGAKFSDSFSIANQVLLPFLVTHSNGSVRQLIVSHADNDHAGAAPEFVKTLRSSQSAPITVYSGEPEELGLDEIVACDQHSRLDEKSISKDIQFKFLWPDASSDGNRSIQDSAIYESDNNKSCVLLIEIYGKRILFTGDIEAEVETRLLEAGVLPESVDILVAPHHGSATSSTFFFVRHLRPEHVIFSAGFKNRYRHPAKKVRQRYHALGVKCWNTAIHGAITVTFNEGKLSLQSERQFHPKRWYLPIEAVCEGKL